jgi:parallel beta-helix repeat protein
MGKTLSRMASAVILVLFLFSMFALTSKIQSVKAPSTIIYINPDGSISSPVPANITTSDNVTYTFTGNNYLTIVVNRSNIIINGGGYKLQVSGGIGFYLEYPVNNVTIKDTTITNSGWGIDLNVSYNDTLSDNNITANGNYGIGLWWSSGDVLSGNDITANGGDGIFVIGSVNNTLSGNNVTANYHGIYLQSSSGNVLSGNVMASNTYNFGVFGDVLSDFVNHVDTSNLVDGKPVYYLMNQSNIVISPQTYPRGVGYLGLLNCTNVTVQGMTLTKNGQGLLLVNTTDSKITDNNVTANRIEGIALYSSSYCTVSGSNITNNGEEGVYLIASSNCSVSGNNITNNDDGICLDSSSGDNTLSGNNVTANHYGIDLYSSSGNVLSGNNITANTYDGIDLYSSSGNTFYHNNFVNNTQQVESDGSPNTWDNGYPSGGNYWSDYLTRYPNATEIDHTGIGDTAYEIDTNNTDHYPLMIQYETTPPTITILSPENKTYSVNASIPLTFTVDEFASWMGYSLDGQANVAITGNTTLPTLLDGGHYVTVYANGTFGKMGSATVYFTVDTTKPNITNTVQDPLTNILPDTVVKINATVTDATSGVKQVLLNCTFTNSTNTWYAVYSMAHLTGDIWNATIPPQPYGTNVTYVIIAEDNAGNTITTEQIFGYEYEYQVVPEFTMLIVLVALVIATSLIAAISKKKRHFP